jgi:hypothetical protein
MPPIRAQDDERHHSGEAAYERQALKWRDAGASGPQAEYRQQPAQDEQNRKAKCDVRKGELDHRSSGWRTDEPGKIHLLASQGIVVPSHNIVVPSHNIVVPSQNILWLPPLAGR